MSKGIEINGQLRGKRGGVVYYRSNGQQISRARAENVSNPNTQPQRIQRMIMATVMQAYSLTKEITDHSFEGVKYKQDSMAFFQRVNANKLRAMITADTPAFDPSFTAPKVQALIPNGYTISRGSLQPVNFSYVTQQGANYPVVGTKVVGRDSFDTIHLSEFMNSLDAVAGDMVTIVWFDGDSTIYQLNGADEEDERAQIKYVTMRYIRMKFKDTYTEQELNRVVFEDYAGGVRLYSDLFDAELSSNLSTGGWTTIQDEDDNALLVIPNIDAHALGVIRSRRDNGVWRRSLCEMIVNPGYHFGLSYNNGLLAWENNTDELGNGDWLLNDKKTGVNP